MAPSLTRFDPEGTSLVLLTELNQPVLSIHKWCIMDSFYSFCHFHEIDEVLLLPVCESICRIQSLIIPQLYLVSQPSPSQFLLLGVQWYFLRTHFNVHLRPLWHLHVFINCSDQCFWTYLRKVSVLDVQRIHGQLLLDVWVVFDLQKHQCERYTMSIFS